jgi:hypothetical protein
MTFVGAVCYPGKAVFVADRQVSEYGPEKTCCTSIALRDDGNKLRNLGKAIVGLSGVMLDAEVYAHNLRFGMDARDAIGEYFSLRRACTEIHSMKFEARALIGGEDGTLVYLDHEDPRISRYARLWRAGPNEETIRRIERETVGFFTDASGTAYKAAIGGCASGHKRDLKETPWPPAGIFSASDESGMIAYLAGACAEMHGFCGGIGAPQVFSAVPSAESVIMEYRREA